MRRPPGLPIAACVLLAAACSSGDGADDAATEVVGVELLPVERPFIRNVAWSDRGQRVAYANDDAVCVVELSGELTPECFDQAPGSMIGLAFSPDGTALAFHENAFQLLQEPDIQVLDVDAGTVDAITDDGVPTVEDGGEFDVSPFFDADGALHFFRVDTETEPIRSQLLRVGDREVVPADVAPLDGIVDASRPDAIDEAVVVSAVMPGGARRIVRIDLVDGSTDELPTPSMREPRPVIAAGGRTLVIDRIEDGAVAALLIDADNAATDLEPPAIADEDRAMTAVGMSPDGEWVVALVVSRSDTTGHQLLVAPIADDGTIGDYRVIATGDELAPTDGDTTPVGVGIEGQVLWVGDRMAYWAGDERLAVVELE